MQDSTHTDCDVIPLPAKRLSEVVAMTEQNNWLIEDIWLASGVGILGGAPKVCKTYLAAEIAFAIATGTNALGRYATRSRGAVLFYGAEDDLSSLRLRFDQLALARQTDVGELPIYLLDVPRLRLDCLQDLRRLHACIAKHQPRLLVLDPFVRMANVDENSSAAVSAVLASLRAIQRQYDVAVLLVHHARKSPAANHVQAFRGSSDFAAWSDSNLFLLRKSDHLLLTIEHRRAAAPPPVKLRLQITPAPHLVTIQSEPTQMPSHRTDLAQQLLVQLQSTQRPMPTVELRQLLQRRKSDIVAALESMTSDGTIRRTSAGWSLIA